MTTVEHADFTVEQRKKLAENGEAMPDGSFPIRNRSDLVKAISAIGRAKNYDATKKHIMKRAKALDAEDLLPDVWSSSAAQSALTGQEFLDHHGVKGMKWGVRRAQKKAAKADKKWQKNIYSIKGAVEVHNAVADRMNNGGIDRLNKRHPKAHLDHDTPATRAYLRDYETLTANYTRDAVKSVHGISPSGALRARYTQDGGQPRIIVESTDARHADDILPTLTFELDVDETGQIEGLRLVQTSAAQSATIGEEFIEHYGVKGMKWGVRKRRNEGERKRAFGKGTNNQKSVKDMSDQELREIVNRMNMEQQYSRLSSGSSNSGSSRLVGAGAAFVAGIALNVARQQIQNQANAQIGKAIATRAAKKASGS